MSSTTFRVLFFIIVFIVTIGACAISGLPMFNGLASVAFILAVDMYARFIFMQLIMNQLNDSMGGSNGPDSKDSE